MSISFEKCIDLLSKNKLTIAFAESVTSGALCCKFGIYPNSGQVFKGGLVCYDGDLKLKYLNVTQDMVDEFTPESAEVTEKMAIGLSDFIDSDISVAVTGLCSPGGSECKSKPVGTIFTSILYKNHLFSYRKVFSGNPDEIINFAVEDIIKEINKLLEAN